MQLTRRTPRPTVIHWLGIGVATLTKIGTRVTRLTATAIKRGHRPMALQLPKLVVVLRRFFLMAPVATRLVVTQITYVLVFKPDSLIRVLTVLVLPSEVVRFRLYLRGAIVVVAIAALGTLVDRHVVVFPFGEILLPPGGRALARAVAQEERKTKDDENGA